MLQQQDFGQYTPITDPVQGTSRSALSDKDMYSSMQVFLYKIDPSVAAC